MSNEETNDNVEEQPPAEVAAEEAVEEQTPEPEKTAEELAAEHLAGWQRALADYENLKKQVAQERTEFAKYATQNLIEDLLPTLDYFDAATAQLPKLESCDEATKKNIENWFVGIQHVQKLLMDKLSEFGLSAEVPSGVFDPNKHEAAEERESEESDGTILQVLAKGYTLHDKLVRPARVIIAKNETN